MRLRPNKLVIVLAAIDSVSQRAVIFGDTVSHRDEVLSRSCVAESVAAIARCLIRHVLVVINYDGASLRVGDFCLKNHWVAGHLL
jgi:hypothetical protein